MPSSPACTCLSCPVHDRVQNTPCPVYPTSSITDAQWAVLEPLLPPPGNTAGRGGRPEKHPRRVVLDAIFYLVRGGIAWAALPRDFPPHQTVYGLFGRWAAPGHVAADPRRPARSRARARGTRPAAHRGDHRLPVGARRGHRARHAPAATTRGRRSTAANATSPWTPAGCCSRSWSPSPASRTATPRTGCWPQLTRPVLHGQPGLGRRRLRRTARHLGPQGPGPDRRGGQTHRRRQGLRGAAPPLGRRAHIRLDQQVPPLRPRLRDPARAPRSDGPHLHDHDHVTTSRPHRRLVAPVSRCSLSRPTPRITQTCRAAHGSVEQRGHHLSDSDLI